MSANEGRIGVAGIQLKSTTIDLGSNSPLTANSMDDAPATGPREPAIVVSLRPAGTGAGDGRSFDLIDLARMVLRERWIVLGCGLIAALLMLIYLNLATYRYTAEMKVTAAQAGGGSGLASSLQKFAGLASIANIQLPQDGSSVTFLCYGELLHSPDVARIIAHDAAVMHALFPNEWDPVRRRWFEPQSAALSVVAAVKSVAGIPIYRWSPPDWHRVEDYLQRWVVVTVEQKRPVIEISYKNSDPAFARAFVELLNRAADDDLRRRSLVRSQQNITYLSDRLRTVTLAEHRAALSQALGEQERTQMMAQVGAPFAAEPIGSAQVSTRPTSPLPFIYLGVAFAGGLLIGALGVLVRMNLRSRSANSTFDREAAVPAAP